MSKALLIFTSILQDSQELGSSSEHMVSRVLFDLRIGSDLHTDLHADVKQTIGTEYGHSPLEISMPQSLVGSISYEEFRELVEQYYRESFGPSGSALSFRPGSQVRMMDNVVSRRSAQEIEYLNSPQRKAG